MSAGWLRTLLPVPFLNAITQSGRTKVNPNGSQGSTADRMRVQQRWVRTVTDPSRRPGSEQWAAQLPLLSIPALLVQQAVSKSTGMGRAEPQKFHQKEFS